MFVPEGFNAFTVKGRRYCKRVLECHPHSSYENFVNRLRPFLGELGDKKTYFPSVIITMTFLDFLIE